MKFRIDQECFDETRYYGERFMSPRSPVLEKIEEAVDCLKQLLREPPRNTKGIHYGNFFIAVILDVNDRKN